MERTSSRNRSVSSASRWDEEEAIHRPNWPIIGAVVAILVFVVALLYIILSSTLSGTLNPLVETVRVPKVTGYQFSVAAEDTELLNGFTLLQVGEEESETHEAGTIIRQEPRANAQITSDDRVIEVVVSSGAGEEIRMPDVRNQPWTRALSQLDGLDLNLKVDYDSHKSYHDTVAEDCVIATYPEAGELLSEGQQVILEISLGKEEPKTVIMLPVIGMTEEAACDTILGLGLSIGQVERVPNEDQPAGHVWYQSVAVNTEVPLGTSVDIFVSAEPNEENTDEEGESQTGPESVTKTIYFELPLDRGDILQVVVTDSQGNTVYRGEYDINMDMATESIPVRGTGQETYYCYINGNQYDSQTVDFGA